jgi:hypothetical protein
MICGSEGWWTARRFGRLCKCMIRWQIFNMSQQFARHIAGNIHMRLTSDVGFSVGESEGVRVGFFDG